MRLTLRLFDFTQKVNYKTEVLSGLTVALALIPEALAFAIVAGLSPMIGLYAAFIMGFITSVFGGRPGMIAGATGAVAVVLTSLVKDYGPEYVFATVILAGLLQIAIGVFRLGKFIRLVPQPVMYGFVNGLGVVIFLAQLTHFKTTDSLGVQHWIAGTPLWVMLGLVMLTLLIIIWLPRFTKAIPSSLAAILIVSGIVLGFGIETKTVGDVASIQAGFPPLHIPQVPLQWKTLIIIFPYSLVVACVGLTESLLTLNLIDEVTQTRGRGNKECVAQGLANITCGFFYGMGGCTLVGQSIINISAGARARLSGIVASVMLLVFIVFFANIVEKLPIAALTGVMFMVAATTFAWASLKAFGRMPLADVLTMVIVAVITIVLRNLALAVLIGVIISALVFAWESAKRIHAKKYRDEQGVQHYELYGPLFFGSVTAFAGIFDVSTDPAEVVIDFKESRVADMSGIDALDKLTERYQKAGKKLHLKHLSPDCRQLLKNAEKIVEVNIIEDPSYQIAVDTK
ncbi:SulP family inorganic anion transporter [Cytophagaceae bacterium YF14B1]|uniref:SulP family inorganic anion transporter n=1 Tax=Xanthocytophaga flava TaxID=3048013 RepID=A0AAE3U470_9BACT|nr:SulP family inorganic anion transporter [Xanthocytophaga flavus]MDJ1478906.1 SulP family inorganic anion transporter [Xanthocytophaga flavus]